MTFAAFVGTPYNGDRFCREFARRVLAAHGIPMPLADSHADVPDTWRRVPRPQALDVVVFNREGAPGHVGVCVDHARFLHVEEGRTSRIERLSSIHWRTRVDGYYRYTGPRHV